MKYILSDIMEFPQFRQYFLPSDHGQPIETAFQAGVRNFLVFDEAGGDWAILQVHEELSSEWVPFVEGQKRTLTKFLSSEHLLPISEAGADDEMVYLVRPFTNSESLNSYLDRVGPLPWAIGAPMVTDLVRFFIELEDEPALFKRLDLSNVRVKCTPDDRLTLELPACCFDQLPVISSRDRLREIATILTKLVEVGEAPECMDHLISLAYGTDEGLGPQSLGELLETLESAQPPTSFLLRRRRLRLHERLRPVSPFNHPDLKEFRNHFAAKTSPARLSGILNQPAARRQTQALPYTATSICLFAVGLTTSGWVNS